MNAVELQIKGTAKAAARYCGCPLRRKRVDLTRSRGEVHWEGSGLLGTPRPWEEKALGDRSLPCPEYRSMIMQKLVWKKAQPPESLASGNG